MAVKGLVVISNLLVVCMTAVLWKQSFAAATQVNRPRGVSLARMQLTKS